MDKPFTIILFYSTNNILKRKTFNIIPGTSLKTFIIKNEISKLITYKFDIGVYGKIKKLDYIIKNGDRLELYVDITANPKIRRKDLAKS